MKSAASDSESGSRRSPFPQTRGLRGEAGDESTGKTPAVSVIVLSPMSGLASSSE